MINTFSQNKKIVIPKKNNNNFGIRKIKDHWNNPLYRNSYYLMVNSLASAILGFLFWIIAAKLYPSYDIGIATVLVSSSALLIIFSRLGFDFSIIRFFPIKNKSQILNTSIIASTFFAIILTIFFVIKIDFFAPDLQILTNYKNSLIFLLYIIITSIKKSIYQGTL